jgi:hypothetical protein
MWPSNSLNLNPSETVRVSMKKKLVDHNSTMAKQWKDAIRKIWLGRTEESNFCQNLIVFMANGMQDVIS